MYDLDYERIRHEDKRIPMEKNAVYIPDFIKDEKAKPDHYWKSDSDKKRHEDDEIRMKEEI